MYRNILLAILVSGLISPAVAEQLPCVAAQKFMRSALPGYSNELGVKQPESHKIFLECLTRYRVCIMLDDGKVLKAQIASEIQITSPKIVFGLVQTHQGASRHYCTFGSLISGEGQAYWLYETFAPNGSFLTEGIEDAKAVAITSAELFSMLDKNFQHSIASLRRESATEGKRLKALGYRDGEKL